jgi:hypothetical protein
MINKEGANKGMIRRSRHRTVTRQTSLVLQVDGADDNSPLT